MASIAIIAIVMAAVLLLMVVFATLVLTHGLPDERDCDVEGKLFSLMFRFKITRNEFGTRALEWKTASQGSLEGTAKSNVARADEETHRLRSMSEQQAA
jgi:hypothetical protein